MREDSGLRAEGKQIAMVGKSFVLLELFDRGNPRKCGSSNSDSHRDAHLSTHQKSTGTAERRLIVYATSFDLIPSGFPLGLYLLFASAIEDPMTVNIGYDSTLFQEEYPQQVRTCNSSFLLILTRAIPLLIIFSDDVLRVCRPYLINIFVDVSGFICNAFGKLMEDLCKDRLTNQKSNFFERNKVEQALNLEGF